MLKIEKLPIDDAKVFEEIAAGNTQGVFQLETRGMTDTAKKVKPRTLEELAIVIALFRPISIKHIDEYAENKRRGNFSVVYPKLRSILEETSGILIYQEQAMRIVHEVATFTLAEADEFRKVIAKTSVVQKEKHKPLLKKLKKKFYKGCRKGGLTKDVAVAIWRDLEAATGYSFNKSHAVSYAYLAYQMMWLKVHYPVEFMTALLNKEIDDKDKTIRYYNEARRLGIKFYRIDARGSKDRYYVIKGKIVPPITLIKGIGQKAIVDLLKFKNRKFPNIRTYMALGLTHNSVTERMIKAGAFDYLGKRDDLYNEFLFLKNKKLSVAFVRGTLIDMKENSKDSVHWVSSDLRLMEKELVGVVF